MGDLAGAPGALTLIPGEAQGALLPGAVEGDGGPAPAISLSLPEDLPQDAVYTLYLDDEPAGQFEEDASGARALRLQFDKSHLDWRPTLFWSLVSGIIWGFSLVVPGLSSSALLIFMGVYKCLMHSVGALDFGVIIPLLGGIALIVTLIQNPEGIAGANYKKKQQKKRKAEADKALGAGGGRRGKVAAIAGGKR